MTYFHMRGAHYHWREVVSLSCSRWEGVGPTCYGRQTLTEDRRRKTEDSKTAAELSLCRDSEK